MQRELLQLMESLLTSPAERVWGTPWRPRADVCQTQDGWLVKFELAGVRTEDVRLTLERNRLTLCGVRRDCNTNDGACYHSMEISYSYFKRTIELPCDVAGARVATEYRDGMLLVRLWS